MTLAETGLVVGVVLALAGIVRVLANDPDDDQRRFAAYLVTLLLSLTLVGYLLLRSA